MAHTGTHPVSVVEWMNPKKAKSKTFIAFLGPCGKFDYCLLECSKMLSDLLLTEYFMYRLCISFAYPFWNLLASFSEFKWQCEVLIQSVHVRKVTFINLEISIYILTSILFLKMLEKSRYQFPFLKNICPHPFSFKESIYQINNYLLRIASW